MICVLQQVLPYLLDQIWSPGVPENMIRCLGLVVRLNIKLSPMPTELIWFEALLIELGVDYQKNQVFGVTI
jgi:hypothetical protein